MEPTRWHSIEIDCQIFADKKSWNGLRYSRHYCKTHKVPLGHQEDEGTSHSGWELHWYGGTPSLALSSYIKTGKYTGQWAYYAKRKPMLSLIDKFLAESNLTSEQREGLNIFKHWLSKDLDTSPQSN